MMKDKVVVITGVARGIGQRLAEGFENLGAHVYGIDILENPYMMGDLKDDAVLIALKEHVLSKHKTIDILINNAVLSSGGIDSCDRQGFEDALNVGVIAPFRLSQLFKDHFSEGGSIINMSSTRYRLSQPDTESYTAVKGAITSLTHALAVSLAGKVRVNAIAPGWIDCSDTLWDPQDHHQHPVKRIGSPEDILNTVLFLGSDMSSFVTGEVIHVDGGMSKQMIYHNDYGWTYNGE